MLYSTQYEYFVQIYHRKWSFFHDFLFFEDKIIDFNPTPRIQSFINKIDLFDVEDNYFQYKVSNYVQSALKTRGLRQSRKGYINRFYSLVYRFSYSYKPAFINFNLTSKRLFFVIDYTKIKRLLEIFKLTDKKILFLKLFYIPQDDFFQTRSLFLNTVNSKLKYRILNNNISFLILLFNKVKETLNSLTVITLVKEIKILKPLTFNFWARYSNLASEWRFYSGATFSNRVLDHLNKIPKTEPIPIQKVKSSKSRFTKKKLLKSTTYRLPIKSGTNGYVKIRNVTLKHRYRRSQFKKGELFYNYKLKDHNFKRFKRIEKIKNFSSRLNSLKREPSFNKVFTHFLRTQNLSTSEQNDAFLRLSLRALHFKTIRSSKFNKKPKIKTNFLLNVNDYINKKNFDFSLNLTSLNYYKLPNLNSFRESKSLFQMDSAFGQPFNLRMQSNPDFFWDEWDVSFLSQQNGLASTLQPYEDDYLGEDRFFSPATAVDHIDQSPHTKKDSTDLEIEYENYFQWRFNKDKFREPHRKSRFKGIRTKRWLPELTHEPSVVYREEPDWENTPGVHNYDDNQEEIIVGDGPLNIPTMTSDRAGSASRPEFMLKRSQTDPFDSTLLYDLYTLNRISSSFSERTIFNHFSDENSDLLVPYMFTSNCEDYFFRQRYIHETDVDFAPGYDLTPLLAAGAWDIPYVIPQLSRYFVDYKNMKLTSKNFVLEGLGNSLDSQKIFKNWYKSFWRERISRAPILRFYDSAFTNPSTHNKLKHSRAFFYNDRALARKFSQVDEKSQVLSPYPVSVFSKTDFPTLLLSFLFAFSILVLVFIPVFFYFFKYEWVSKLFYNSPFFEFWDMSGLPNFTKPKFHGIPSYSDYGGYVHEKFKVIQAYYKRYRYPDEYEYKMMIEKMKFDAAQKDKTPYTPVISIPKNLKTGEVDFNRVTSPTYTNIPRVLELYDIAYEDDVFSALKNQTIPNLASLKILHTNINEYYPVNLKDYPIRNEFTVDPRFDGRRVLLSELLGIKKDTLLGNFFYRKTDQTSLKRITNYGGITAYRVLPLISGQYNLTNQFLSSEHPYLNEAIRANFSSRTNRIFNFVRHSFFDRYHVENRPYDIFRSDTRYGYSNTSFKPPFTSILNTQTDIFRRTYGRVVPASVETPQLRIRFGQFDRPSNWEVTPEWFYHPQKLDGKMTFGEIFYRLWNRLFVFGPSESIGPRKDDYLTVGQIHFPFAHQRTPDLFFYNDVLENTPPITRIPRKISEEVTQELREFYFKSETEEEEEELLNVIRDYKAPVYNYLFEEKLNNNSAVLKSKPYNVWGVDTNFKNQASISSIAYTGGGSESFHVRSYRMPLHSSRSRMTPYFNMYLNRRMTTNLNAFGFDPFKIRDYFNNDNHPFKEGFPYLLINKDFLSFRDLDSQRLRWFLSLDGSSNIGDSSVYNPAHGYRSYWFSKVGIDNTTRAHKSLLHVGSNYELRFMLTIPTFWELYYNSKWISKLDDIFTTTNSELMYKDDNLRDYSYTQGSFVLYSFYFLQDLIIRRIIKLYNFIQLNFISIRNMFFLLGFVYIFFPKYYYLRQKYYMNISNSVILNRLSLASSFTVNKTENLVQSDDISNSYSKGYNKKFNISLFSRLKKKKSLYKLVLKSVVPEKLGSGSKQYGNRFLKRPKTLKNKIYSAALNKDSQNFIKFKKYNKRSTSVNPNFKAIALIGYSFLWSTKGVNETNSFKLRSELYKKSFNIKTNKTKRLNFVKRNLPYKLSKSGLIGYLNYEYGYSQYGTQDNIKQFSPQIKFSYEQEQDVKLSVFENRFNNHVLRNFNYKIGLNTYLNKKTNFARRRLIWSYLRGLDRENKKLFKKPTVNQDYLLSYIKNQNRLNFKKNISNLITLPEVFIKDNSTLFKAVDELNTFKIDDSLVIEKDEPTIIIDIDEDDEDEQIDSEEAREVEPVEQIALIADSEETEDYFDSLFLDLVFKITPPNGTAELTLKSLLKVDSKCIINDINYGNYHIYSELINYKRFRSSTDDYTYSIPTYELSLNDDIVQDLTFSTSYNFLVSYSMPRFLKRLSLKSSLDFRYNTQITKFYDETDPEGFDIKPIDYYSLLNIKRDRLNELNYNEDIPFEFNVTTNEDFNLLFEKFSLNSDNSIISKIDYTDNQYKIDLNFNEESYFNSDYHIEEYDESAQLFESRQFYRWRYLSYEYLSLILNRESEFKLTQLKPFKTRSDFIYDIFLKGEDFNFNQEFKKDLVSDYIEDSVDINFELEDLIDYIIDEFDYEEDNISLFDEEIGDEDDDLKEDDEDFSIDEVKFIKEEDNIMDFILREIDISENSLQQQLLRFDPALIAESDSIVLTNKYKRGAGFATRPIKNLFEQNQKDFWDDLTGDYRLNDKYYSDKNYDSSVSNDLVDLLIPLNQKQIIRITEDNDMVISADTVDRVILALSPETIERGKSDLLMFRAEIIKNNLNIPLVTNLYSTEVNNKDLLIYLILVQSPDLNQCVTRAKYSVIHEIQSSSVQSEEVEDLLSELNFLLSFDLFYDKRSFFNSDFTELSIFSNYYDQEKLNNDNIYYRIFQSDSSLKLFALNFLYFSRKGIA